MKSIKKDIILSVIKVIVIITIFVIALILDIKDAYIICIRIRYIGSLIGILCGLLLHYAIRELIFSIKNFIYDKKDKPRE